MTPSRWRTTAILSFLIAAAVVQPEQWLHARDADQAGAQPAASSRLTSPKATWGHDIGDDHFLVNYQQLADYWSTLARQSPRLRVVEIGKTSENRPMLMGIITSPANHKKLDRYKEISSRLATAAL